MERFTNSSEYERQQARQHARVIAFGIATAFFALAGIGTIISNGRYSWLAFGTSILAGMVAWGFAYAIVYVIALPTEGGEWGDVEEREIEQTATPPNETQTNHFTAIFDGRLRLGNTLVTIPPDVGESNIVHIAEMRRRGALENVSLRALDSIGISRFAANTPNAQSVMRFLSRAGAIDENGNWTQQGLTGFPYPPQSNSRGVLGGGVSTNTTTTTGHHHLHRGVS